MGVRIDIGLDLEGNHTFAWEPSEAPRALDIPETVLLQWGAERQAFLQAQARWHGVMDEIEECLHTQCPAAGGTWRNTPGDGKGRT